MKFLKVFLLGYALSGGAVLANTGMYPADGFLSVDTDSYKPGMDGVFLYCDKPDIRQIQCFDVQFDGSGMVEDKKTPSKWRTADDYVKYALGHEFEYVGMSAPSARGLYLFYRKNKN